MSVRFKDKGVLVFSNEDEPLSLLVVSVFGLLTVLLRPVDDIEGVDSLVVGEPSLVLAPITGDGAMLLALL